MINYTTEELKGLLDDMLFNFSVLNSITIHKKDKAKLQAIRDRKFVNVTREEIGSLYRTLESCVGIRKDNTGTVVYLSLQAEFELTEWLKVKGVEVREDEPEGEW